jgi:hypothetical protein
MNRQVRKKEPYAIDSYRNKIKYSVLFSVLECNIFETIITNFDLLLF